MNKFLSFAAAAGVFLAGNLFAQTASTVETLVCIRHGEKPANGLGQLNARGLNRALALPDVLLAKFGKPDFIFAPNTTQKVDGLTGYYYVRPLMTIEPTAIRCGLPINTEFGYLEIKGLARELKKSEYKSSTVFVAWEHVLLDQFVKDIVHDSGGETNRIPSWPGSDFDSIFVVKITRSGGHESAAFIHEQEGLTNLSDAFPQPARP